MSANHAKDLRVGQVDMSNRVLKIACLSLLALVIAVSCFRRSPMEKYRESNVLGGEMITIDVCLDKGADTKKASRALDDAWQRLRDIYQRMSNWIADSDMGKMNRSYQNPQQVGADTI